MLKKSPVFIASARFNVTFLTFCYCQLYPVHHLSSSVHTLRCATVGTKFSHAEHKLLSKCIYTLLFRPCVNHIILLNSIILKTTININASLYIYIYRVSQEEWTKLRESVPYVKLYRYNPKHLYPKLNGYGDNGQRNVWTSCISAYCTSTAVSRIDLDSAIE